MNQSSRAILKAFVRNYSENHHSLSRILEAVLEPYRRSWRYGKVA